MVIDTDVFGDAIEPRVKGRVATEGINSTKRFEPCFLRQVFGSFGVFSSFRESGGRPGGGI